MPSVNNGKPMKKTTFIFGIVGLLAWQSWGQVAFTLTDQPMLKSATVSGGFDCTSPTLWTSPILQQQTNDNDFANFAKASWRKQHMKNTSSVDVKIKKISLKMGEVAGVQCSAWMFVEKTNQAVAPVPDLGSYSGTNTIAASAPIAWVDFTFTDANAPVIPANTDFFWVLRFDSSGAGSIRNRRGTTAGGTFYIDDTYAGQDNADVSSSSVDWCFEVYICQ